MIKHESSWNELIKNHYNELKGVYLTVVNAKASEIHNDTHIDNFHTWLLDIDRHNLISRYDSSKSSFITYLWIWCRGYIEHERKKLYNKIEHVEFEDIYSNTNSKGYMFKSMDDIPKNIQIILKNIVELCAGGCKNTEIRDILKISRHNFNTYLELIKKYLIINK